MQRRDFFVMPGALAAGGSLASASPDSPEAGATPGLRVFDVRKFGARGDGKTLDTQAINRAIGACGAENGGIVYLAPGVYLSGTVELKSNVTLYLEAGATLLGSKNIADYPQQIGITKREGFFSDRQGFTSGRYFVYARDAENIGIAGPGKIDGNGPAYWISSGRKTPPPEDGWRDNAQAYFKPLPRPSPMVEIVGCRNVRIEDVRLVNAPGFTLRPINCDDVVIRGIAIKNPVYGPNTDGIDPTGCRNVFISDSTIDTGDDCIVLKSENPYGEEIRTARNITITNCVLTGCCNGLKFGTPTWGGIENVMFTNSVIFNERVEPKARIISGVAVEMVDGGWLEGVLISNIRMQNVKTPIFVRRGNRSPRPDGTPGILRGIRMENIYATGSLMTSSVTGLPGFDIEDVSLSHIHIGSEERGKAEWADREIAEVPPKTYPEAWMYGKLPSYGFYCRHVRGLHMRGIEIDASPGEARSAIVCDDVKTLDIDGLRVAAVESGKPIVKLSQTRGALLRGCSAPAGTRTFLEISGDQTERILLAGSDIGAAGQPVLVNQGVPRGAVSMDATRTVEGQ